MAMDSQTEQRLKTLLQTQKLAALATQEQDAPYLSLMAYTATDDLKHLVIATKRGTRKYHNMIKNPVVALLIDNRSHGKEDFQNALAVSGIGTVREIEDQEKAAWRSLFLNRHPALHDFVHSPECALLRVDLKRWVVVSRFDEVEEIVW
jgi:general stress protein 26